MALRHASRHVQRELTDAVHKESIDIATADIGREGEVRHLGSIGGDLVGLDKALC